MDTITLNPHRPRRRCYSREFKAQIVAACKQPGISVAAIARMHDMNDNMVHRWLREAEQSGADLGPTVPPSVNLPIMPTPAFIPVLPSTSSQDCVHLELMRNDLTLRIDWPVSQAHSFLQTLLALLR